MLDSNQLSSRQLSRLFSHASTLCVESAWELAPEGVDIKGFLDPNVLPTGQTWGCLPFHAYAPSGSRQVILSLHRHRQIISVVYLRSFIDPTGGNHNTSTNDTREQADLDGIL
jgi:hypothetical protein